MSDRKLGICTNYCKDELTYAAIHLADKAINNGIPTSIYSADTIKPGTCSRWDHKIISSKSTAIFFKWILNVTHLLWTSPPPAEDIEWANSRGIETWLLASWDTFIPAHRAAISLTSKIITPYDCVSKAIQRKWQMSDIISQAAKKSGARSPRKLKLAEFMWDVPLPISTKKDLVASPNIKLLFPLFASQEKRVNAGFLFVLNEVLQKTKNTEITLALNNKSKLMPAALLANLKKMYGDRITVVKNIKYKQRYSLYASNDLTVWGAMNEGLALVGLNSLCMGTPVVAWDIDPQSEYLHDDINSVLVPCDIDENWFGVPTVLPDWNVFASRLLGLLQSPPMLAKLQDNSSFNLASRKQDFNLGWRSLWRH